MRASRQLLQSALFERIKLSVCNRLGELDAHLTYHNLAHTLDVIRQSERLAKEEGQEDGHQLFLLKVAALYHDMGFLRTYRNHEEVSCLIFLEDAPAYNFSAQEQTVITQLIMATKLPQRPNNHYEKIICDADLDYLGRPDFFTIGEGLRREFLHFGIVASDAEWEALQIKFLSSHQYHTETSIREREPSKQRHLSVLHNITSH